MARTVRDGGIDTRNKRLKLAARREPYWAVLTKGCALGYRKTPRGGSWIARFRDEHGKQHYQALGPADDALDSDGGGVVLSHTEAQRKAAAWFDLAAQGFETTKERPRGPYLVSDVMREYREGYERAGGKAAGQLTWTIDAFILPDLGQLQAAKLKSHHLERWFTKLASSGRRLRTKPGQAQRYVEAVSADDTRRRKSSANRILTVLKAGLNKAFRARKIPSDEAWRHIKAFRQVDAARVRYLSDKEAQRLVNASTPDFRPMVQAALLTGCRYSEIAALRMGDFNSDAGTIHIRTSKSGKARHVVLTDEGRRFFSNVSAGKGEGAVLVARSDGDAWGKSHQHRPFKAALAAAKLSDLAFHELRHTYASRLVMKGVPLAVVAAQLGHTDTRMVEKHYGHMAESYVANTVRAAFTDMGLVGETNVRAIGGAAS